MRNFAADRGFCVVGMARVSIVCRAGVPAKPGADLPRPRLFGPRPIQRSWSRRTGVNCPCRPFRRRRRRIDQAQARRWFRTPGRGTRSTRRRLRAANRDTAWPRCGQNVRPGRMALAAQRNIGLAETKGVQPRRIAVPVVWCTSKAPIRALIAAPSRLSSRLSADGSGPAAKTRTPLRQAGNSAFVASSSAKCSAQSILATAGKHRLCHRDRAGGVDTVLCPGTRCNQRWRTGRRLSHCATSGVEGRISTKRLCLALGHGQCNRPATAAGPEPASRRTNCTSNSGITQANP